MMKAMFANLSAKVKKSHQGRHVSKGFWTLCLSVWSIFIGLQLMIGWSWIAVEALPDHLFEGVSFLWVTFFAWPPLVATYLLWGSYLVLQKTKSISIARDLFLEKNGESSIARAAFKQDPSRPQVVCRQVELFSMVSCAMGVLVATMFIKGRNDGLEFVPTVFITLFSIMLLFFSVICILIEKWENKFPGKNPIRVLGSLLVGNWFEGTVRRDFDALPSVEKQLLIARASKMGADPNSVALQRAAIQDYKQRVEVSRKQAQVLEENTAEANSDTPSRRL